MRIFVYTSAKIEICRNLSAQFFHVPATADTLCLIEETSQRVIDGQNLNNMRKRKHGNKLCSWGYEFLRQRRTFFYRFLRCRRRNCCQVVFYLWISQIELTAICEQSFVDSPSVHTFSQTLQQPFSILGAVIAMLFILYNIESYDIVPYRGKAVYSL